MTQYVAAPIIRLVSDKPRPYCENYFALKIYGKAEENDESISIIGNVIRAHQI